MKYLFSILTLSAMLLGCTNVEKEDNTHHEITTNHEISEEEFFRRVRLKNKYLVNLLNQEKFLSDFFETEISYKNNLQDSTIMKLIPLIDDGSIIYFGFDGHRPLYIHKGLLTLLTIYKLEEFPYAMALGMQWCTGGSVSNEIHLPEYFSSIHTEMLPEFKKRYTKYFYSSDRHDWITDNGNNK